MAGRPTPTRDGRARRLAPPVAELTRTFAGRRRTAPRRPGPRWRPSASRRLPRPSLPRAAPRSRGARAAWRVRRPERIGSTSSAVDAAGSATGTIALPRGAARRRGRPRRPWLAAASVTLPGCALARPVPAVRDATCGVETYGRPYVPDSAGRIWAATLRPDAVVDLLAIPSCAFDPALRGHRPAAAARSPAGGTPASRPRRPRDQAPRPPTPARRAPWPTRPHGPTSTAAPYLSPDRSSARLVLRSPRPHVALVATTDPDGDARQAVVWYRLRAGRPDPAQLPTPRRWCTQPARESRACALSVIDGADGYRWLGLTGVVDEVDRRRRARAGRHRRARPPLPPRGPERRARSPRSAPSRGSRSSSGSPASTTTWRTDPMADGQDRVPALAPDRLLAGHPRRRRPRRAGRRVQPLDVGPPHLDRRAVGGTDPRGLVRSSPAGRRSPSGRPSA